MDSILNYPIKIVFLIKLITSGIIFYSVWQTPVAAKMLTYFDETISSMESIRFLNRNLKLINELRAKTHFGLEEIQNLLIIHYKLTREGGPLNYRKFREVAHRLFDIAGTSQFSHYLSHAPNRNLVNWWKVIKSIDPSIIKGQPAPSSKMCRNLSFNYIVLSLILTPKGRFGLFVSFCRTVKDTSNEPVHAIRYFFDTRFSSLRSARRITPHCPQPIFKRFDVVLQLFQ